jgi:hypothetical protein
MSIKKGLSEVVTCEFNRESQPSRHRDGYYRENEALSIKALV